MRGGIKYYHFMRATNILLNQTLNEPTMFEAHRMNNCWGKYYLLRSKMDLSTGVERSFYILCDGAGKYLSRGREKGGKYSSFGHIGHAFKSDALTLHAVVLISPFLGHPGRLEWSCW